MDTRIEFTLVWDEKNSYPIAAFHEHAGMKQFAIFIGSWDDSRHQGRNAKNPYGIAKKYFNE